QVVVLDQERGVAAERLALFRQGRREATVDVDVCLPCLVDVRSDRWRRDRVPKVVVREPQHAVGDAVLVAVVDVRRDVEVPEAVPNVPLRVVDPAALGGRDHLSVALGHRGGHPDALRLDQGAGKRRDQTAGAAPSLEGTAFGAFERQRASVRGDDERWTHTVIREINLRVSSISRRHRKRARTSSRPASPIALRRSGSRRSSTTRAAHSPMPLTRKPVSPSSICRRMPPTAPPTTGFHFHIPSATTRPNPSRSDFWTITSDARWNAFTALSPTPLRLVGRGNWGSPAACSVVRSR